MTTKMERVAQDVVMTAARMAGTAPHRTLDQEAFKSAFQEAWPIPGSARPMNDAINTAAQAASKCTGQDMDILADHTGAMLAPGSDTGGQRIPQQCPAQLPQGRTPRRVGYPDRRSKSHLGQHRRVP